MINMSMWEPFDEHARKSIVLAQEAAQELRKNFIGADEIFMGIMREGGNGVVTVMEQYNVTADSVQAAAERVNGRGNAPAQEMVFTPEAKRLIELGFEEARHLGHRYIASEHLVLGYLRSLGQTPLLTELQVDADELRTALQEHARGMPASTPSAGKPWSLDEAFSRTAEHKMDLGKLWARLRDAAQKEDAQAVWPLAFCIAQRNGWTAREAAERIDRFVDDF